MLYRFGSHIADGSRPQGLVDLNHTLYGTTLARGKYENGLVFSVTRSGKERLLHSFTGPQDGSEPRTGLVDIGGTLYERLG